MDADVGTDLPAIEIRGIQIHHCRPKSPQVLDRLVRQGVDVIIDGRFAEEAAQNADPFAFHALAIQVLRVVRIDMPDTPRGGRIFGIIADQYV